MALRDLLAHVDQSERSMECLRLAGDLAHRHGSRLTAIYVREPTAAQVDDQRAAELGLGSAKAIAATDNAIRRAILDAGERSRVALEEIGLRYGLEVEWRCIDGVSALLVPQHARFADLCVVGQDPAAVAPATGYTFAEQLLFVTGRPVVFVPPQGVFRTLGRHILVAWNSSRASARAVNDALPLLERADKVTVLAVNPAEFADRYEALPPEHMVAHLRRHGAAVEGRWISDVPSPLIATTVQDEARVLGVDLIVAGAFGQPRLWERLMGGVTRDLLARMSLPVMMSY